MTSTSSRAAHPSPPAPQRHIRPPTPDDAAAMWRLAVGAVDENSPYAYLMMCEYFADTCVVAEEAGRIVGFVTGFRSPRDPETQFVWQIVVDPSTRGTGLGGQLLDACTTGGPAPALWLEATVTPDNDASARLFRGFARRRGVACAEDLAFAAEQFPADGGAHEPEMRLRIGPLAER